MLGDQGDRLLLIDHARLKPYSPIQRPRTKFIREVGAVLVAGKRMQTARSGVKSDGHIFHLRCYRNMTFCQLVAGRPGSHNIIERLDSSGLTYVISLDLSAAFSSKYGNLTISFDTLRND